jgi:hypothetical protein
MFASLVPFIQERLEKHHELYTGQCKAEYWEENLCYALKKAGFGSDWAPDFNHGVGVDQSTDNGTKISNKGGNIENGVIEISGSRLTKHKTLQDKLEFLSVKKEDYIFCLATDKDEWKLGKKVYYFIVIDSDKLNYHDQQWNETFGQKGNNKDKVNGWSCISENYSAKIVKSMSDQLWTRIKLDYCEEIHEIVIR